LRFIIESTLLDATRNQYFTNIANFEKVSIEKVSIEKVSTEKVSIEKVSHCVGSGKAPTVLDL